jgi:uncharacterized membrane protein YtjA (UPF0391 family)
MLNLAVTFFVIAIIEALLGFGGVAGMSAGRSAGTAAHFHRTRIQ